MLILTAESCMAIGRLIGCIAAYNCQLRIVQMHQHNQTPVLHPAQYVDTDSIKIDMNRMYGVSAMSWVTLMSDLRAKWSAVCDAAVELKSISNYDVVIGGAGPIIEGYNRAVQVQLLDSADVIRMSIDITYDGQHYVTDTRY